MSVAIEGAVGQGSIQDGTTVSANVTPAGVNRAVYMALMSRSSVDRTVTAATIGGTAATAVQLTSSGGLRVAFYRLLNPAAGSALSCSMTLSSTANIVFAAWALSGVNQITPEGTPVTNSGTTSPATTSVTSTAGGLVLDGLALTSSAVNPTPGGSQTEDYDLGWAAGTNPTMRGAVSHAGAVSSMTWTFSNITWRTIAVPVNPAPIITDGQIVWGTPL